MDNEKQLMLRVLPSVQGVIQHNKVKEIMKDCEVSHTWMVKAAQETIDEMRTLIINGKIGMIDECILMDQIIEGLYSRINCWLSPKIRRVINGTGVVLHTNLGRAPLSSQAIKRVIETSSYYCNLEYDIKSGKRDSRQKHVEELICQITGAEAAMMVNNNAAAVYLVLNEIAKGKEVIISRGQLVEIGGSFRISEIMMESGAQLIEVGTANKTHLYDYERAIGDKTALLMKVHTSNFLIVGFTSSVSSEELSGLGSKYQIPVYEDLGSGALIDLRPYGIGNEPTVKEILEAGTDIVSFSGDKLLGGPQAGIIAGRKKWIDRLKCNQLSRILRVDKMTLAAMDTVLRQYLLPHKAIEEIPVLRDILLPLDEIKRKAVHFMKEISDSKLSICLVEDQSELGGGTMPGVMLPTYCVMLKIANQPINQLEKRLRMGTPPVIIRIQKDQILIDFRTIQWEDMKLLIHVVKNAVMKM